MPAADLVRYCAHCDSARAYAVECAEDASGRAAALAESPRKLATKTDIDGTHLCARCQEYAEGERRLDFQLKSKPDDC
jgi:hypothetical protein